jgi:nitroreductase
MTSAIQDLLAARYGAAHAPAIGATNEVVARMLAHRSVRDYLPDALPPNTLETLIAAAQSAPTSSNMQTWSVVAVVDPALKNRLADAAQDQRYIRQCPLFLCFVADVSRASRIAEAQGLEYEALPMLECFVVGSIDCALAAQNAALAAESLGLGTCMIGAVRNDPERFAAELNLPRGCAVVVGLCVGAIDPARAVEAKPRLPQSVILHRERYDCSDEAQRIAAYDETVRNYGAQQRRSAKRWTQRVRDRLGEIASLNGRERLRGQLMKLGFPLR